MLISTKPDTKGKAAVLFRSRQLTEFKWIPLADIPTYTRQTGKTKLPAGEERLGMVYSSPEPTDKFLFENVSFETFMTVLSNPDGAIYTKDLNGHNNSWAYYGFVCNGLARYALNIRRRYSTKRFLDVPGMRVMYQPGSYTAEQLQLCDVLHVFQTGASHVALITDILRDESGKICQIEVSEAVRPTCKRAQYDLETYFEKFKLYKICRYDFVDDVPMPAETEIQSLANGIQGLPVIAVDYGNKSNYRTGEDVVISVFTDGENAIEICRDAEVIENITITGRGKVSRRFDRGYYTARHKNTGEKVEFCVTEPKISYRVENGMLTVNADACDPESKIVYMDFREKCKEVFGSGSVPGGVGKPVFYTNTCASLAKVEELTDTEKQTGVFTRAIPEDGAHFKVYFENKYGVWTHTMIKI